MKSIFLDYLKLITLIILLALLFSTGTAAVILLMAVLLNLWTAYQIKKDR